MRILKSCARETKLARVYKRRISVTGWIVILILLRRDNFCAFYSSRTTNSRDMIEGSYFSSREGVCFRRHEKFCWRHYDVIMTSSKFKTPISQEPNVVDTWSTAHFVHLGKECSWSYIKSSGDISMTSLWRHQNSNRLYLKNQIY